MVTFQNIKTLLKDSFKGFSEDKVPKLGGSLAYFTIFSIGPMLLVVIFLAGLFLGKQAVEGNLYEQIHEVIGPSAARQIQQLIKSTSESHGGGIAAIIGIVVVLIGATGVFTEMQDSINTIWHLKMKPNQGWHTMLKSRILSFGVIAAMGFLLLVSLAATALLEGLGEKLADVLPGGVRLIYALTQIFTLVVAAILFAVIFKILPSADLQWKEVWPGGIATAILFMIGRFLISFYISKSNFGSTYGAASSLVVVLVWIYYSSLIVYFGAEFTRAYVNRFTVGMRPKDYALITTEKAGIVNEVQTKRM